MRVGIIGSGQVGLTLAAGFKAKGHDIVVGSRDTSKKVQLPAGVRHGTFAEAAKHGEVLVMCVHGAHIADAVAATGPGSMAGKLVLETSNALEFGPNGAHKPSNIPDSCFQVAQRAAPTAKFVKAWNCTPGHNMVDPKLGRGDQLICGNDAGAKKKATEILESFGWNVADVGDATMAPYIEGMGLAVINWAAKTNDWGWIVKLQGRTA